MTPWHKATPSSFPAFFPPFPLRLFHTHTQRTMWSYFGAEKPKRGMEQQEQSHVGLPFTTSYANSCMTQFQFRENLGTAEEIAPERVFIFFLRDKGRNRFSSWIYDLHEVCVLFVFIIMAFTRCWWKNTLLTHQGFWILYRGYNWLY